MFAPETSLQVENPELILADAENLLKFVSTQQSAGVTFRAIAKKLGVSRQWLYLKVAEAKEKVPVSDKSEDPMTNPEVGLIDDNHSDNTASAMPGESAHGGSST